MNRFKMALSRRRATEAHVTSRKPECQYGKGCYETGRPSDLQAHDLLVALYESIANLHEQVKLHLCLLRAQCDGV